MKRFLLTAAVAAAIPAALGAQERRVLDLAILADTTFPGQQELLAGMLAEIEAVVGNAATIRADEADIRLTGFDLDRANALYDSIAAGEADVVLVFGPVSVAAVGARESYAKPTIVGSGINYDLFDMAYEETTSEKSNFTYVATTQSYELDLNSLRNLVDFRHLGVVMPEGPAAVLPVEERLRELAGALGAEVTLIPYRSFDQLVGALSSEIDAVYLAESFLISREEVARIAQLMISRGLPSFSAARREDVVDGLLATNQPEESLDTFFRRIALLVEAVLNGEDLAERSVLIELGQNLTINFHTARAIGVPIRFSLVPTAEFVGEYENPVAEWRYTLLDLVQEVVANDLQLESGRRDVLLSEQDVQTAWSAYLPNLNASATGTIVDPALAERSQGQNPQYGTSGSLTLEQILFSPDANASISIQGRLARAQAEVLLASEWDAILDASEAYFTTLSLKANLEIQNRNLEVTKRNLRIAERSFEAGQAGRGDILRLQSESARGMQSLIEAVNALEQSFHRINQLVNQPISREIDVHDITLAGATGRISDFERLSAILDDPGLSAAFEDWLVRQAVGVAPELKVFDENIAVTLRNARLNGIERYLPTLAAGLQYDRTFNRSGVGIPDPNLALDGYYSIGISASVPLFNSNQRAIQRETAQIQRGQLEVNREFSEDSIERAARDIVLEMTNQLAGIELGRISEEAAVEALELSQAAYGSGAITLVELLDAQTNHLQAQLNLASATYSFLATSMTAQRLAGHFFILNPNESNDAFVARFEAFAAQQATGGTR